MMVVPDASVMVSVFHEADEFHDESREWLHELQRARDTLVAPMILLSEVAGALARRTGDTGLGWMAAEHLEAMRSLSIVPIDEALGHHAYRAAAELRLKGADAVYVALAESYGVPLVTWDREQLERGQHWATTLRPTDPRP